MIELRATQFTDFENLELDTELGCFSREHLKRIGINALMYANGAISAWQGGKLLGLGDLFPYKDGYYVWAAFNVNAHCTPLSVVKLMKRRLDLYTREPLYAHVKAGHKAGERLLAFLGFRPHTALERAYGGVSFDLWHRST